MSEPVKPPAPNPCGSCPYRRDVPSGLWEASEYRKLPEYDGDTGEQPMGIFLCHRQDGRACAGWCGVHDMNDSLALRLGQSMGTVEDPQPFFDYTTSTPLFKTGAEAARHGMADVEAPGPKALEIIAKLESDRDKREEEEG
jgi:hypothetical protein